LHCRWWIWKVFPNAHATLSWLVGRTRSCPCSVSRPSSMRSEVAVLCMGAVHCNVVRYAYHGGASGVFYGSAPWSPQGWRTYRCMLRKKVAPSSFEHSSVEAGCLHGCRLHLHPKDCGSSLWWASLATFFFGVVFGQLLFNMCFACTDCDHELPSSFGFMLLDFKLVNAAVRHVLPFDPDASHLPVARPVTLRTTSNLIGMEKVVGDIAQVSIQVVFLHNTKMPHGFVVFSVLVGILHGALSLGLVLRECVQDEWALQAPSLQSGTALLPGTHVASSNCSVLSSRIGAADHEQLNDRTRTLGSESGGVGDADHDWPSDRTHVPGSEPVGVGGRKIPDLL